MGRAGCAGKLAADFGDDMIEGTEEYTCHGIAWCENAMGKLEAAFALLKTINDGVGVPFGVTTEGILKALKNEANRVASIATDVADLYEVPDSPPARHEAGKIMEAQFINAAHKCRLRARRMGMI